MPATPTVLFTIGPSARLRPRCRKAAEGGAVNTIVVSEASVRSENRDAVPALLEGLGLKLVPLPISAAIPAAKAFAIYLEFGPIEEGRTENRKPRSSPGLPDRRSCQG